VDHDACGVGFVAQLGSPASRAVVERALTALLRLTHRGGVDADGSSGDGAGLLVPIPEPFVRKCARDDTIELPESFGLGMVFLPPGSETPARTAIESIAEKSGLRCLGWRIVPTNPMILGPRALATLPFDPPVLFRRNRSGRQSRTPAVPDAQARRGRSHSRNVFFIAVVAHRGLQRTARALAGTRVLSRP
jgi:glutamate synthase domain-containing protein 1